MCIRDSLHTIIKLYLYPFSAEHESTSYITPDVTVTCHSGEWSVSVSCSAIENYRYNDFYLQMMRQTSDKELKSYFLDRFKRCQFIFHAIEQRTYTLTKISEQIIKYQKNFFLNRGPKSPMTMNALACLLYTSLCCNPVPFPIGNVSALSSRHRVLYR